MGTETIRFKDVHGHQLVEYEAAWSDFALVIRRSYVNETGWDTVTETAPNYSDLVRKAKFHRTLSVGPHASLFQATLTALRETASWTGDLARNDPNMAFKQMRLGRKPILAIDKLAQNRAIWSIREQLAKDPRMKVWPWIVGEETLHARTLNLQVPGRPVISLDVVDGTDQLEQGTNLWCSAATIYEPREDRILASFVVIPGTGTYFAMEDFVGMCRFRGDGLSPEVFELTGPSQVEHLSESLLACYGHKAYRLDAICDHGGYRALLARMALYERGRIRMDGGNPWIIRMIDSVGSRRTDGVFDLFGQAPHDMAPAAHIALKKGAVLIGLNGLPIHLPSLLRMPKSSGSRVPYILAATSELAEEIRYCLSVDSDRDYQMAFCRASTVLQ